MNRSRSSHTNSRRGASAAWREGFQRLVTDVGMGHAGIVMGLEVSRLARNNADWHRLLEICALADTLILDEDGVYDPASFNDRLLLVLNRCETQSTSYLMFYWATRFWCVVPFRSGQVCCARADRPFCRYTRRADS